ncbi:hypothetical protein ABGB07_45905 [Micromonosporaceae bacterium B7E4]
MRRTSSRWTGLRRNAIIGAAAVTAATGAALAGVSPAAAAGPPARAAFVTPVYGMDCHTGVGGSWPYVGWATCSGAGYWLVRTACTSGFTYDSQPVWQMGGGTMTAQSGSCVWGVDSVQVIELVI